MEESGGRKRKMGNEEDDEEEEEEKVEKFFALVRSTREVRDRIRNGVVQVQPNGSKEEEKVSAATGGGGGQWNPTFRPEDFMEDSVSGSKSSLVLKDANPSSETKHGPGKERKDGGGGGSGLDLNLSLSLQ